MRLHEIEYPTPHNPVGTLITIIQFILTKASMTDKWADKDVRVSTDTVLKLMNNAGMGFSYQDLDALVNSTTEVKNRIASMTKDVMVVRTNAPKNSDDMATSPEGDSVVNKMADRASKRAKKSKF